MNISILIFISLTADMAELCVTIAENYSRGIGRNLIPLSFYASLLSSTSRVETMYYISNCILPYPAYSTHSIISNHFLQWSSKDKGIKTSTLLH